MIDDPLGAWVEGALREGGIPGGAWWVGRADGSCESRGAAGVAVALPESEPLQDATPFDLASLTKPMATAVLALLLEQDGILDLSAPLDGVLEEAAGTPFAAATVEDLGRHRAGFAAWRPVYLRGRSRADYLSAILRSDPAILRGSTLYSDLSYLVLGFVLERLTGSSLDALFEARIARPCGLGRCGYATGSRSFSDAAATERGNAYERRLAGKEGVGFAFREHLLRGEVHDGNAWGLGGVAGNSGLFGTVADVVTLASLWLDGSPVGLGDPARRKLLLRGRGEDARTFGLHPASVSDTMRGVLAEGAVGHMGFTGTSAWVEPEDGTIFVLLTNRVHPTVPDAPFLPFRREFHRLAKSRTAA